jgi:hypothetical protein
LIPIFKFCKEKVFMSFETLKPDSQEMAQNVEKRILQKCFRITFYTYKPVNPFHYLKKHQNRCTLLYILCTLYSQCFTLRQLLDKTYWQNSDPCYMSRGAKDMNCRYLFEVNQRNKLI